MSPTIPEPITPSTCGGGGTGEELGVPAFGTQIQVMSACGPPDTFTTISGVGDISGPNTSVAETETTSHSTGSPHRTFIPTLIDDGEISFPDFWNPSDPTQSLYSPFGLENLFQNRAVTKWRLVTPDASNRTREFLGFVKTLGETYPVQGVMTRNVSIRITSVPKDVQAVVTLTPAQNITVPATETSASITVATTDTMSWGAVSDAPSWLTIDAPTSPVSGNGTVDYTATAQLPAAPARTGHILVGDKSFLVTQAAGA